MKVCFLPTVFVKIRRKLEVFSNKFQTLVKDVKSLEKKVKPLNKLTNIFRTVRRIWRKMT